MKTILSILCCILTYHCANAHTPGQSVIDSLKERVSVEQADTTVILLLSEISYNYHFTNPDTGLLYGLKALEAARKINFRRGIGWAYNSIGVNYHSKSEFKEALDYFFKALKIGEETNDKKATSGRLGNIASIYMYKGEFPLSLSYFLKALKISEEIGDKNRIASNHANIAILYGYQKNYTKSLEHSSLALPIYEETGMKNGIATALSVRGLAYAHFKDYTKALADLKRGLVIDSAMGNKNGITASLANIGSIYFDMTDFEKAMEYHLRALTMAREIGQQYYIAISLGNIGVLYKYMSKDSAGRPGKYRLNTKMKNVNEGIKYLEKATSLCRELGFNENLIEYSRNLVDLYVLTGNYKGAFESYRESEYYDDSVFNSANKNKIDSMQMQYAFDKKAAISKAELEKKAAVMTEKNRAKIKVLGISAISILLVSFMVFYFYRKREKDRFEQELLEVRQEALNAQMSDHFIGNTMDSINGFIKNNDKEKASEYLILFSRLIRSVLDNATEKLVPLKDDLAILNDYVALEKLRFNEGALEFVLTVQDELDTKNTLIPPMVFQVLVENAIKHGFRKTESGRILLSIRKKNDTIECLIEDNGAGRRKPERQQESQRISHGSNLAEKLIKTGSRYSKNAYYTILDLLDENNMPRGTKVVFSFPFISAE